MTTASTGPALFNRIVLVYNPVNRRVSHYRRTRYFETVSDSLLATAAHRPDDAETCHGEGQMGIAGARSSPRKEEPLQR